jgi:uncharacterized membrane protein YfcA
VLDLTPLHAALALLVGVFTGVMSAAFGVGGAVISTPAVRALGLSAIFAVGTTLPAILPSAVSGTARYANEGLIEWRVVAWTAPTGILAAVGGSFLSHAVPGHGHWLMILTAALLGYTAYRMSRPPRRPDDLRSEAEDEWVAVPAEHAAPSPTPVAGHDTAFVLALVGGGAGLMSGLLGIGGGVVMVPGFTEVARIPLKTAIATSLACVGIFAIPGTLTHWHLHDIDWWTALFLSIGVIPGARIGAHWAIKASDRRLRLTVAGFLAVSAVIYGTGEVIALVR